MTSLHLSRLLIALFLLWAKAFAADVCETVSPSFKRTTERITIRGVAGYLFGELAVFDQSCPVFTSGELEIPTMIQILLSSHKQFEADRLYQVAVSGKLRCKRGFRINVNESGEPVYPYGLGEAGYFRCQLVNAHVIKSVRLNFPSSDEFVGAGKPNSLAARARSTHLAACAPHIPPR